MSYAFTFDSTACTGCKACQEACKDKNNLPAGVLWRRVIEVSGGEWVQNGGAWENTVFAYNLTMACNHCVHPKCAGVCPVDAYDVRPDGIILLDSDKCAGCGYCNWACPYAVPQYNPAARVMSKCNFCFDEIESGRPPACVAACPLRVLDYREVSDDEPASGPGLSLWALPGAQHPFPLPTFSRTQPHLHIKPHPAMLNPLVKSVGNREEIKPVRSKSELPLVAFSLLAQMAAGALWASLWIFQPLWALIQAGAESQRLAAALVPILPLALGALISFAHLGRKRNAWRMLGNLRKSWLSREVLALGVFGAALALNALVVWINPGRVVGWFSALLAALAGFGLVRAMASIYRLRSMVAWNTWRTLAGFLISTVLLGHLLQIELLFIQAGRAGINLVSGMLAPVNLLCMLLLAGEFGLAAVKNPSAARWAARLRPGLVGLAVLGFGLVGFAPAAAGPGVYTALFLLVICEEYLGRWLFYEELGKRTI